MEFLRLHYILETDKNKRKRKRDEDDDDYDQHFPSNAHGHHVMELFIL